jgi:DNA-binding beta-propeller fold protein YncE
VLNGNLVPRWLHRRVRQGSVPRRRLCVRPGFSQQQRRRYVAFASFHIFEYVSNLFLYIHVSLFFPIYLDLASVSATIALSTPVMTITLGGSGSAGTLNGVGTAANFSGPWGVAADPIGQYVFIADSTRHVIRQLEIVSGTVSILAGLASGSGSSAVDGVGTAARFKTPAGLTIDTAANFLYVADSGNNCIRRVDVATSTVTTVTTNGGSSAFSHPQGVAIDATGQLLFVADTSNHRVRKVVLSSGVVSTLAGSGNSGNADNTGVSARFSSPRDIAIDPTGSFLYVADSGNHRVRKIVIASGVVTTFVGSGAGVVNAIGTSATFRNPFGIATDPTGQVLFVADHGNNRIRLVNISSRAVTVIAGSGSSISADGLSQRSAFSNPRGIAVDPSGRFVYVSDWKGNRIRMIQATAQCQAGQYCFRGAILGFATEGTYMLSGASALTDGVVCPAGSFCYAGASSAAGSGQCVAGFFCLAGSVNRNGGRMWDARGMLPI